MCLIRHRFSNEHFSNLVDFLAWDFAQLTQNRMLWGKSIRKDRRPNLLQWVNWTGSEFLPFISFSFNLKYRRYYIVTHLTVRTQSVFFLFFYLFYFSLSILCCCFWCLCFLFHLKYAKEIFRYRVCIEVKTHILRMIYNEFYSILQLFFFTFYSLTIFDTSKLGCYYLNLCVFFSCLVQLATLPSERYQFK